MSMQQPQEWAVWEMGAREDLVLNVRLTPSSHPLIFQALNQTRNWILFNPNALDTLTALTFDTDFPHTSPIFRERRTSITLWLYGEPPTIDFEDSDYYGSTPRPPVDKTPFFARTSADRQRTLRIRLAKSLLRGIVTLQAAIKQSACHARVYSQLRITLFLLERTVLHELAHAARSIFFSIRPSPTRHFGLHRAHKRTKKSPPETGVETHMGIDSFRNHIKRGENGWGFEARTGGEVRVYVSGQEGIKNFNGFSIVGVAMEISKDVWRCIDLGEEALLKKLANADWNSIDVDLASMPSTASFQTHSILRTGGDVATPCSVWASLEDDDDEQQDELDKHDKHNEPDEPQSDGMAAQTGSLHTSNSFAIPESPCPPFYISASLATLSLPSAADDDDDDSSSGISDVEETERVQERVRAHFGPNAVQLPRFPGSCV